MIMMVITFPMPVFPPVTTTILPSSLFWDSQYLALRFLTTLDVEIINLADMILY